MNQQTKVTELIQQAGAKFVSVTFAKKDGTRRQLTFNPKDISGVKGTGSPCSNPNIFRVRDIKLGQWRSFDVSRTLTVKVNGTVHTINQEES